MKHRILAVVLALVFVFAMAGCSKTAEEPAEVKPPFFDEELGLTVYPVGNTGSIGDWDVTLANAFTKNEIAASDGIFVPEDNNTFVVLSLNVTNNGAEEAALVDLFSVDGIFCALVPADGGDSYSPGSLSGYDYDLLGKAIAPGATVEGDVLVFDVPNDALDQHELWNIVFYTDSLVPDDSEGEYLVFQTD